MNTASPVTGWPRSKGGRRQRGQAMVFGLFVLAGGLASLFFLFNLGQVTHDKDKLTNTADAVAYSAGAMHARALNYAAYTNRALLANEIGVAQLVSLGSWSRYMQQQSVRARTLGCNSTHNYPASRTLVRYSVLCMGLAAGSSTIGQVSSLVNGSASMLIGATEASKVALMTSQLSLVPLMAEARRRVMSEVANANYRGDGSVQVDLVPLEDQFMALEGRPVLQRRTGDERQQFADVAVSSANRDAFIPNRGWRDTALLPTCVGTNGVRFDRVDRAGGTSLIGLNEWKAMDTLSHRRYRLNKSLRCVESENPWAGGSQFASRSGDADSGDRRRFGRSRAINPRASARNARLNQGEWGFYSGIPNYLDLSDAAQLYAPENSRSDRRELAIRFSIRLTRTSDQQRTSEGRSLIRPGVNGAYRINNYVAAPAGDRFASVSTSEVFFDRPVARSDGRRELANTFNPYWQVRLVRSQAAINAATALQGF